MDTRESTVPVEEKAAELVKPIFVELQPIADSLIEPFESLIDQLVNTYSNISNDPIIDQTILAEKVDQILRNSLLSDARVKVYEKIVLEVAVLHILSSRTHRFYNSDLATRLTGDLNRELDVDLRTRQYQDLDNQIAALLDLSIYLTAVSQTADVDLPFLLIHHTILKNDSVYVLNHFQDTLFSPESTVRREYLIHQCGIASSTKRPGTEILEIYQDITKIFSLQDDINLQFIANWRFFISNCFKSDDSALNNPSYNISKHFDFDRDLYMKLKHGKRSTFQVFLKVRHLLTNPDLLFNDRWVSQDNADTIHDLVDAVIKQDSIDPEYKKVNNKIFDIRTEIDNELEIEQLQKLSQQLQFSPSFTVTEESFPSVFETKTFRQYLMVQIDMLLSHVLSYWDSASFKKTLTVRSDFRLTKDFCNGIRKKIQVHYKKLEEPFFFTFNSINHESNKFWVEWKSSNFKIANETSISQDKITKAQELVDKNCKMRPRHIPKYGTNEISRIWSLETGLSKINKSEVTDTEQFELFKEQLDNLENTLNTIEEDPDMFTPSEIASYREKKEILSFKALRLHRENGNWLSFSKTNYKLGVNGLSDPSLIEKFKEEQALADKEQLEKDKIILDEEGDVVMDPVVVPESKPTETKPEQDDDLDY